MQETFARLLEKRGYTIAGESSTGESVRKFEKEDISKNLFNIMKTDQFFRVISHFLFKRAVMNVDDFVKEITRNKTNINYTLKDSIVKKYVCRHCQETEILSAKYDLEPNISCQKCGRKDYEKSDDWEFKIDITGIIIHYLNILKNSNILAKQFEFKCPNCFTHSEYFEEDKVNKRQRGIMNKMFCKQCRNFKEIKWVYTPPIVLTNFWKSNKGDWLEWYTKNLLLEKGMEVLQGIKLKGKNRQDLEVDCIILKSNKIISIECRAKSFDNTYNEDPDIAQLFPFSDYVILLTTTKISESVKTKLKLIYPKCKKLYVDGNEIEKLSEIIEKI